MCDGGGGAPGGPGDAPGPGGGFNEGSPPIGGYGGQTAANLALNAIPVIGPVLSAVGFADLAQGDPNSGQGVSGPDGGGGVGGGPGDFPVVPGPGGSSAPAAPLPVTPSVIPDTITQIKDADLKRNRIGRKETILTSRGALSEPSIYRPTLLGQ
jgi:hypothetical protein